MTVADILVTRKERRLTLQSAVAHKWTSGNKQFIDLMVDIPPATNLAQALGWMGTEIMRLPASISCTLDGTQVTFNGEVTQLDDRRILISPVSTVEASESHGYLSP